MSRVDVIHFLVTLFGDDELFRLLGGTGEKPFKACSSDDGKHLSLPQRVIVLRQFFRDCMADERIGVGSGA
jgi:hypothetical protein